MSHGCDDELAEGLALGLLLGWGWGRRRRRPAEQPGCSDACAWLVVALLLVLAGSVALHLWYVTLPVVAAAVAWRVVRVRHRRPGSPPPGSR